MTARETTGDAQTLPTWLVGSAGYEPLGDRAGYVRKNVLSLASMLLVLRADPQSQGTPSALERMLARVSAALRLLSVFVLVLCVSLAYNMAFVWVVLVGWLLVLASLPAQRIRAVLAPSLGVAGVALLVNMPALLLGQTAVPLRMAAKSLATVGPVMALATSLGVEGLLGALRTLHLPRRLTMVLDLALRDVVMLGESAVSLSEALALRSVGRDRTKMASAAGVMGVVFVRAHVVAEARGEAMLLRGYDGEPAAMGDRHAWCRADMVYLVFVLLLVGFFVYSELALS